MQQSACSVINPITVDNFAALFNCTTVIRCQTLLWPRPKAIHFGWFGPELFGPFGPPRLNFASDFQWCCLAVQGSPTVTQHVVSVESSSLLLRGIKT